MVRGLFEAKLLNSNTQLSLNRFKLHLRPRTRSTEHIAAEIPPLPPGKTVIQVFADYLHYLFQCTSSYIKDTHANGHTLWASVENHIDFVLSHPNGWEGPQQNQMREAAVLAKLIPSTPEGHARISFVTEGEASLHFSINNGFSSSTMKVRFSLLTTFLYNPQLFFLTRTGMVCLSLMLVAVQ